MSDILNSLNDQQREAVMQVEGPVMVFAGAGTGKTRTLISRIIYMILEKNINPRNILAITFTKKATNEMRERLNASLPVNDAKNVRISTIHALCNRILRRHIEYLGYKRNFEIIDDEESIKVLNEVFKEEDVSKKIYPPKVIQKVISDFKNQMVKLKHDEKQLYEYYQNYLFTHNMIDLDDLLVLTKKLLVENEKILSFWQEEFRYILVDEFQDTNKLQYEIIKMLCFDNKNIFVVGDDDQSIYSFRGAQISNMLDFPKEFENVKVFKLVENYRSSNAILKGANSLIKNNEIREQKELFSKRLGELTDVKVQDAYYYEDEIRFVTNEISHLIRHENYAYNDIAILYRNNALSRNFELALIEDRIPYNLYGGYSYLKRKEIKDIISYLRFIMNPIPSVHFKRIIDRPSRGIGDKTLEKVYAFMSKDVSFFDAIDIAFDQIPSTKIEALHEFKNIIVDLQNSLKKLPLIEFFDEMVKNTGYLKMLEEEDFDEQNRVNNINEFKSVLYNIESTYEDSNLTQIEKVETCLDDVMLDSSISDSDEQAGVILSTVHSVKGLEFKAVFVVGLEEGIFPAIREDVDMEEERRVAYVAFTRAKDRLYLTSSSRRLIYGRIVHNNKSRFLKEFLISNDFKKMIEEQLKEDDNQNEIVVGSKINHQYFGYGIVVSMDNKFMQILFEKDNSIRKISLNHPTVKNLS